jgi:hypothetical protein
VNVSAGLTVWVPCVPSLGENLVWVALSRCRVGWLTLPIVL